MNTPPKVCKFSHAKMCGRRLANSITARASGALPALSLAPLARQCGVTLAPDAGIKAVLALFDDEGADELAVVDHAGRVIGVVTEKHARRRYLEEIEAAQRRMFGES